MKTFLLSLILTIFFTHAMSQSKQLDVGDTLPSFTLLNQNDSLFKIEDYVEKKILVIYFYPKDETMVCTKEACAFRDSISDFTNAGAMVIGISSDTPESHRAFIKNHNLNFTLLSDPDYKVLKMFGIKSSLISTGRVTFVVDLSGKIVYTYSSLIRGKGHVDRSLKFVKGMRPKPQRGFEENMNTK